MHNEVNTLHLFFRLTNLSIFWMKPIYHTMSEW